MDITEVLNRYPWLADGPIPFREVEDSVEYLTAFTDIDLRRSAYSLKRDLEMEFVRYVRERAFLVAAAIVGYDIELRHGVAYLR